MNLELESRRKHLEKIIQMALTLHKEIFSRINSKKVSQKWLTFFNELNQYKIEVDYMTLV